MQSHSRITPLLVALSAPLLVQLVWLLHNTQLPISDSTGSLEAAYRLSKLALDGHWQEFLTGLYTIRDWRPTALCLIQMPFCIVSGGNLMFTAAAMTWVSTAISVTYIYRLLRLELTPYRAALGAAMLGLMPVVQWPATFFGFTETPFLAAMLATFYHLLRTDFFSDRRQCFFMAIAATLAFWLRPIEALFHFLPLLTFTIWLGMRRGKLSGAEVYATITTGFIAASVLVLAAWWPNGLFILPESAIFNDEKQGQFFLLVASVTLTTTLFLITFMILRPALRPRDRRSYLMASIASISAAVCLFYLRFMTELVQWIYITNFGELSNIVAPRSAFEKLTFFFFATGAIPLTVIILVAAGMYARSKASNKLYALLVIIPIPLLTPFITCQYSQRKMTVMFSCLLIIALSLALKNGSWQKVRLMLIAVLALCQCTAVTWISTGREHSPALEKFIGSRIVYPDMVTISPNPHYTISDFLIESARRHNYHSISLPILAGDFVPRIADPFLLRIVTEIRDENLKTPFPRIIAETADQFMNSRMLFGGDAFLVAPEKKLHYTPAEAEEYRRLSQGAFLPSDKSAYGILALHAEGKLESIGIRKRECAVVAPTEVEVCLYDYR